MIMAQDRPLDISSPGEVAPKQKTIKRQRMQNCSKPFKYDVQQEAYNGPKKPLMPPEQAVHHVPPLSLLASQAITKQRALANDFAFLQDIHTESKCPEHNGYNTNCVARPTCSLNHIPNSASYNHSLTDPLLTLIPSKPQSTGAYHLPELHVRTY